MILKFPFLCAACLAGLNLNHLEERSSIRAVAATGEMSPYKQVKRAHTIITRLRWFDTGENGLRTAYQDGIRRSTKLSIMGLTKVGCGALLERAPFFRYESFQIRANAGVELRHGSG